MPREHAPVRLGARQRLLVLLLGPRRRLARLEELRLHALQLLALLLPRLRRRRATLGELGLEALCLRPEQPRVERRAGRRARALGLRRAHLRGRLPPALGGGDHLLLQHQHLLT